MNRLKGLKWFLELELDVCSRSSFSPTWQERQKLSLRIDSTSAFCMYDAMLALSVIEPTK